MSDLFTPEFDNTEIEIDYNAPEPGSFPPQVEPGKYNFVFKLADKEPFSFSPIPKNGGSNQLIVKLAPEVVLPGGEVKRVAFQQVNTFKSPKMSNSSVGELLRALDIRLDRPTVGNIREALTAASGQKTFRGEVAWEAYFKDTQVTVSTQPRKSKGDLPWPKDANGKLEQFAANPATGDKVYARERITRYLLPKDE